MQASGSSKTYIRLLEAAESELSVWRDETTLSQINAQPVGKGLAVSSSLFALFKELIYWWDSTGRVFDPGVGELLRVRGHYANPRTPSQEELDSALRRSGMQYFNLAQETNEVVRQADVRIDSGAFGKGEGLDRVFQLASREGGLPWLIDLGGQVMVYGQPPGQTSWNVAIAHPQHRDETAFTMRLHSGSLATSGVSEQPGHILDPRTGRPAEFKGSVTVWHERALVADILSTALFVMGPDQGLLWAESRGLAACFLIGSDTGELQVRATEAFRRIFQL